MESASHRDRGTKTDNIKVCTCIVSSFLFVSILYQIHVNVHISYLSHIIYAHMRELRLAPNQGPACHTSYEVISIRAEQYEYECKTGASLECCC